MSDTASEPDRGRLGRRWRLPSPRAIDIGFGIWVVILLVAMIRWLNYETIPYHIIFVSLAVVYGFTVWSRGVMNLVLLFLILVTGAVLLHRYVNGYIEAEELSEIVLMPLRPSPMMDESTCNTLRALVEKGSFGAGVLETDDCQKTYEDLKAKGVTFKMPPEKRPYGIEALLKDDSGNWFSVVQRLR